MDSSHAAVAVEDSWPALRVERKSAVSRSCGGGSDGEVVLECEGGTLDPHATGGISAGNMARNVELSGLLQRIENDVLAGHLHAGSEGQRGGVGICGWRCEPELGRDADVGAPLRDDPDGNAVWKGERLDETLVSIHGHRSAAFLCGSELQLEVRDGRDAQA